ncbi:hypothetical protein KA001_02105, partial [Patescibacteria group bacterium]|nr:hypothetical protein [Patescibacteria group bacterium]
FYVGQFTKLPENYSLDDPDPIFKELYRLLKFPPRADGKYIRGNLPLSTKLKFDRFTHVLEVPTDSAPPKTRLVTISFTTVNTRLDFIQRNSFGYPTYALDSVGFIRQRDGDLAYLEIFGSTFYFPKPGGSLDFTYSDKIDPKSSGSYSPGISSLNVMFLIPEEGVYIQKISVDAVSPDVGNPVD